MPNWWLGGTEAEVEMGFGFSAYTIIIIFILTCQNSSRSVETCLCPQRHRSVVRPRIHTQTWVLSLSYSLLHCLKLSMFPLLQLSQLVRICHHSKHIHPYIYSVTLQTSDVVRGNDYSWVFFFNSSREVIPPISKSQLWPYLVLILGMAAAQMVIMDILVLSVMSHICFMSMFQKIKHC